jgi:hypothetical protein
MDGGLMSDIRLADYTSADEAHLVDGTVLTNVDFVRATGYDTTLWVKGIEEYTDALVLAPRDSVVKVVVK